MTRIEKLREVNETLNTMIIDLETRLFVEGEVKKKKTVKRDAKSKETTNYK
jgi:hypothetical protein